MNAPTPQTLVASLDTRLYRVAEHILHALCAIAIPEEKQHIYRALEALGAAEIAALNRVAETRAQEASADEYSP